MSSTVPAQSSLILFSSGPPPGLAPLAWLVSYARPKTLLLGRVVAVEATGPHLAYDLAKPGESSDADALTLVVRVQSYFYGEGPATIRILAPKEALRANYVLPDSLSDDGLPSDASRSPVGYTGPQTRLPFPKRPLLGTPYLFDLQPRNPHGAFYRDETARVFDGAAGSGMPIRMVDAGNDDFAFSTFDSVHIDQTGSTDLDVSLPGPLRLMDLLANDLVRPSLAREFRVQAMSTLWGMSPLASSSQVRPVMWTGTSAEALTAWFQGRFADGRLAPPFRDDLGLLALRANWGDSVAYARFRARIVRQNGRGALQGNLPALADAALLRFLIPREREAGAVAEDFMYLSNFRSPADARQTLSLASSWLGKETMLDARILEALRALTKDPTFSPFDAHGIRPDLADVIPSMRRKIEGKRSSLPMEGASPTKPAPASDKRP